MSTTLRRALWRETFESVDDLLRLCSQYERMCREDEKITLRRRQMRVSEVVNDESWERSQMSIPPSMQTSNIRVEAVRPPSTSQQEFALCWNCHDIGHVFSQCPQPQSAVFCFTCGMNGVITVTCPKCTLNMRRGQPTVGTARPAIPNLQTMIQRPPPQIPSSLQNRFKNQGSENETSQ